jgi:hypothetical protein
LQLSVQYYTDRSQYAISYWAKEHLVRENLKLGMSWFKLRHLAAPTKSTNFILFVRNIILFLILSLGKITEASYIFCSKNISNWMCRIFCPAREFYVKTNACIAHCGCLGWALWRIACWSWEFCLRWFKLMKCH